MYATCCAGSRVDGIVACAIVGDRSETGREDIDKLLVESAGDLEQRALSADYRMLRSPAVLEARLSRIVCSCDSFYALIDTCSAIGKKLISGAVVHLLLERHGQRCAIWPRIIALHVALRWHLIPPTQLGRERPRRGVIRPVSAPQMVTC